MGKIVGSIWLAVLFGLLIYFIANPIARNQFEKIRIEESIREAKGTGMQVVIKCSCCLICTKKWRFNYLTARIMIPLGTLFGLIYLVLTKENRISDGLKVGLTWVAIYYFLDFFAFTKILPSRGSTMSIGEYIETSGTLYIFMPFILALEGYLLNKIQHLR
jgi:hypothetical protein